MSTFYLKVKQTFLRQILERKLTEIRENVFLVVNSEVQIRENLSLRNS